MLSDFQNRIQADHERIMGAAGEFTEEIIFSRYDATTSSFAEPVTLLGFIDQGREVGTNQMPGDGVANATPAGKEVRVSAEIEIPDAIDVTANSNFEFRGQTWQFIRVLERDPFSKTLLVVRQEKQRTRGVNYRGV